MTVEQRNSLRRVIKTKALLALDGRGTDSGRTTDVGMDGLGINFPDPVDAGRPGYVRFTVLMEGQPSVVTARVKTQYCIFSQGEFKVGLQFMDLDQSASVVISRYLR
ncbi:hypothetical protein GCM10027321_30620 [Massilia terrae]|uniref:PilZ domain-containing protein n=1 Tax=Massilia terrae TaxID=1811224 RepID=A0ABT2D1D5_9BURK|nr:PilZ domain-containing protein [Massilia terrae]